MLGKGKTVGVIRRCVKNRGKRKRGIEAGLKREGERENIQSYDPNFLLQFRQTISFITFS